MKTLKQWGESKKDLSSFLNIGDEVDIHIADYFIEVLPPATWTKTMIQMGEPYTHIIGQPAFLTLERSKETAEKNNTKDFYGHVLPEAGNWIYTGIKTAPKKAA